MAETGTASANECWIHSHDCSARCVGRHSWITLDAGLANWPNNPFNPWKRVLVVTPKPIGSGPDVRFGGVVAKVEMAVGEHDVAEPVARLIASAPVLAAQLAEATTTIRHLEELVEMHEESRETHEAQLAEAVGLLRELHANMNHQTGPGCCPSGRFLVRIDATVTPNGPLPAP